MIFFVFQEFVSLDGLESLLDSLCHLVGPKFNGFSDAILQIDCLSCIRAVLNSRIGMDALMASPRGLKKLLKGLHNLCSYAGINKAVIFFSID